MQPPNLVLVPGTPASPASLTGEPPSSTSSAHGRTSSRWRRSSRRSKAPEAFRQVVVHTGQHYDSRMSDEVLADLDFPDVDVLPRRRLRHARRADGQGPQRVRGRSCSSIRPDVVVVAGDVNSTLACALAASKLGIADRPRRGRPAVVRLEHAGGGQPRPHRPARRPALHAQPRGRRTTCEAEGIGRGPRLLRRQHDDRLAAALREARAGDSRRGRPSACASAATCS